MKSLRLGDVLFTKKVKVAALRLAIVIIVAWCVCKWLCIPVFICGASMEPRYSSTGFNFCWTPAFWLSKPKPGGIVIVKYAGSKAMLLKRVLATEGQTVQFVNGKLIVDGKPIDEPYVKGPCDWNTEPRKVAPECIYIAGDNRTMPSAGHVFGEVELKKVKGSPLW